MLLDGIFVDEFGFDYIRDKTPSAARTRQSFAVTGAHKRGFAVIVNGFIVEEVFKIQTTNYPNLTITSILGKEGYTDFYFYEDHQ